MEKPAAVAMEAVGLASAEEQDVEVGAVAAAVAVPDGV